jgi:hypothetical protein
MVLTLAGSQVDHQFSRLAEVSRAFGGAWSFRITLRSEPSDAARTLHPIVKVSFAGQAFDVSNLRAFTVCLDLPITLGDPLRLENDFDSRGFAHVTEYAPSGHGRKPYSGLALNPQNESPRERGLRRRPD